MKYETPRLIPLNEEHLLHAAADCRPGVSQYESQCRGGGVASTQCTTGEAAKINICDVGRAGKKPTVLDPATRDTRTPSSTDVTAETRRRGEILRPRRTFWEDLFGPSQQPEMPESPPAPERPPLPGEPLQRERLDRRNVRDSILDRRRRK